MPSRRRKRPAGQHGRGRWGAGPLARELPTRDEGLLHLGDVLSAHPGQELVAGEVRHAAGSQRRPLAADGAGQRRLLLLLLLLLPLLLAVGVGVGAVGGQGQLAEAVVAEAVQTWQGAGLAVQRLAQPAEQDGGRQVPAGQRHGWRMEIEASRAVFRGFYTRRIWDFTLGVSRILYMACLGLYTRRI